MPRRSARRATSIVAVGGPTRREQALSRRRCETTDAHLALWRRIYWRGALAAQVGARVVVVTGAGVGPEGATANNLHRTRAVIYAGIGVAGRLSACQGLPDSLPAIWNRIAEEGVFRNDDRQGCSRIIGNTIVASGNNGRQIGHVRLMLKTPSAETGIYPEQMLYWMASTARLVDAAPAIRPSTKIAVISFLIVRPPPDRS